MACTGIQVYLFLNPHMCISDQYKSQNDISSLSRQFFIHSRPVRTSEYSAVYNRFSKQTGIASWLVKIGFVHNDLFPVWSMSVIISNHIGLVSLCTLQASPNIALKTDLYHIMNCSKLSFWFNCFYSKSSNSDIENKTYLDLISRSQKEN